MNTMNQITSFEESINKQVVQVLLGTAGLTIASNIYVDAIVPISMQTFGVILMAFLLPRKQALQAIGLYLLAGAVGLPVFANYRSGLDILIGSNGGYFLGFVLCVYIVNTLKQRFHANESWQIMLYGSLGTIIIWICGATWLSYFIGFKQAVEIGITPFMLGDLVKITLVTTTLKIIENKNGQRR